MKPCYFAKFVIEIFKKYKCNLTFNTKKCNQQDQVSFQSCASKYIKINAGLRMRLGVRGISIKANLQNEFCEITVVTCSEKPPKCPKIKILT